MLYRHMLQLYTFTDRIHIIKTSDTVLRKIYLSLYLKGSKVRGSWRPNRTAIYWPPLLWPSALCLSRSRGLLKGRPGGPLSAGCWLPLPHLVTNGSDLQLTDFLSSPSYIIVQSPTQHLFSWLVRPEYATSGVFGLACLIIKRK